MGSPVGPMLRPSLLITSLLKFSAAQRGCVLLARRFLCVKPHGTSKPELSAMPDSNHLDRFDGIKPVRACQKSTLRLAKQVNPHDSIE